jgi:predicted GIY-YIG superfamily endonuclease
MYYVYFLRSLIDSSKTYIGFTTNIENRLQAHNHGESVHTQKHKPWQLVSYVAFDSKEKATEFEKYVKIGSGFAFAKRRLW